MFFIFPYPHSQCIKFYSIKNAKEKVWEEEVRFPHVPNLLNTIYKCQCFLYVLVEYLYVFYMILIYIYIYI